MDADLPVVRVHMVVLAVTQEDAHEAVGVHVVRLRR